MFSTVTQDPGESTHGRSGMRAPEHPLTLERFDDPPQPWPVDRWLGAHGQEGPVYQARRGEGLVWSVGIDFGQHSCMPFREQCVWEAAGVVVIGGGDIVYVLDAANGQLRRTIPVSSYFGYLELVRISTPLGGEEELLFVLGCSDVHAIDATLATRWVARDIAVDGLVFVELRGTLIIVSAEMDPPGGWIDVALDLATGAIVA